MRGKGKINSPPGQCWGCGGAVIAGLQDAPRMERSEIVRSTVWMDNLRGLLERFYFCSVGGLKIAYHSTTLLLFTSLDVRSWDLLGVT